MAAFARKPDWHTANFTDSQVADKAKLNAAKKK
jgi:hypothetical protein